MFEERVENEHRYWRLGWLVDQNYACWRIMDPIKPLIYGIRFRPNWTVCRLWLGGPAKTTPYQRGAYFHKHQNFTLLIILHYFYVHSILYSLKQ